MFQAPQMSELSQIATIFSVLGTPTKNEWEVIYQQN
jgi:hypothetical protein